jgi:hypothetical protein
LTKTGGDTIENIIYKVAPTCPIIWKSRAALARTQKLAQKTAILLRTESRHKLAEVCVVGGDCNG